MDRTTYARPAHLALLLSMQKRSNSQKYRQLILETMRPNAPISPNASNFFYHLRVYAKTLAGDYLRRDIEKAHLQLKEAYAFNQQIITIFDEKYPQALKQIPDPPLLLFARGNTDLLLTAETRKLSVVGTRNISPITFYWLNQISTFLAKQEIVAVSGLANGVDIAVQRALIQAGGCCVSFLPHSAELINPLRKKITDNTRTLLLSEYPPGTPAMQWNFPRRNRLIAAFAPALLFAEGGEKSGALITVKYAQKYKKKIFFLKHRFQTNNRGAGTVEQNYRGKDISRYFPIRVIQQNRFLLNSSNKSSPARYEGAFYLGGGRWVKSSISDFSLEFLQPVEPGSDFEPYSG